MSYGEASGPCQAGTYIIGLVLGLVAMNGTPNSSMVRRTVGNRLDCRILRMTRNFIPCSNPYFTRFGNTKSHECGRRSVAQLGFHRSSSPKKSTSSHFFEPPEADTPSAPAPANSGDRPRYGRLEHEDLLR